MKAGSRTSDCRPGKTTSMSEGWTFTSATSRSWSGTISSTASPGLTTAPSVKMLQVDHRARLPAPGCRGGSARRWRRGAAPRHRRASAHLAQLGRDLLLALVEHLLDLPLRLGDGGVGAVHLAVEVLHGALQGGHGALHREQFRQPAEALAHQAAADRLLLADQGELVGGWRRSGPARRGSPPAAGRCGRAAPGAGCSGWRCAPRTARAGRAPRRARGGGCWPGARAGTRSGRRACPSRRRGGHPGPSAPSAARAAFRQWCRTARRRGASAPARPPPWSRRGPGSRGRCRLPGAARCGGCPPP